jgi:virulence factor Mce-like protein
VSRRAVLKRAAGIFAILAFLAGGYLIVTTTMSSAGAVEVTATFDNVKGLVNHADINLNGAKVGQVASIEPSEDGRRAVLTFALERDLPLRRDAAAQVRIKSLLGEMYVNLDLGEADEPLEGGEIKNTSSDLSLDDILASVSGLIVEVTGSTDLVAMFEALRVSFAGTEADLQAILDDSAALLAALAARSDALARIVTNIDTLTSAMDGRAAVLGDAIAEGAATLAKLRSTLAQNVDILQNTMATLQTTLRQLDSSRVNQALAEIPMWLTKIDRVITLLDELTAGKRPIYGQFVSLPDLAAPLNQQFAKLAQIPWLREPLIRQLEALIAATPGTG